MEESLPRALTGCWDWAEGCAEVQLTRRPVGQVTLKLMPGMVSLLMAASDDLDRFRVAHLTCTVMESPLTAPTPRTEIWSMTGQPQELLPLPQVAP